MKCQKTIPERMDSLILISILFKFFLFFIINSENDAINFVSVTKRLVKGILKKF